MRPTNTVVALGTGEQAVAVRPVSVPAALPVHLAAYPNPFTSRNGVMLTGIPEQTKRVIVHTVQGTPVRTLSVPAGHRAGGAVFWDGKDDAGNDSPAGIYGVSFDGTEFVSGFKIIKLR